MSDHRHRKPRFLKAAAIFAWALQGILMPWMQTPAYAANPDTVRVSVTPISFVPPDPIADLLASPNLSIPGQISLTWTAPQGNAGGTPIPNVTVASYSVHLATFSVDSLLGDTTAWWNASIAGNTSLQPPGYSPKPPGSLEAYTFTGVTPGGTSYFGIKSTNPAGTISPIDTKSRTAGQQPFAVAARPAPISTAIPQAPNGVLSTSLSNGLQVQLSWTPVTLDTSGNPVTIDHYLISRYSVIGGTPTALVTVAASTTAYSEATGGTVYYYRIQAVSTPGAMSPFSDYLDSSLQANRYAIANDDLTTRVIMPHDATLNLLAANNPYKKDLEVTLTHQPQDEVNVTLRSYKAAAQIADTEQGLSLFVFPQNNISVQLGLGATLSGSGPLSIGSQGRINAAALAQIISVYWFNGSDYVRVGSPILTLDQAVSVTVRNLGVYQIRAVSFASNIRLTQWSPYPPALTPNRPANRR